MKKISFFLFILLIMIVPKVYGETEKEIEIFHVNKGVVVGKRELTPTIEKEVEHILDSINGVYQPFTPIPEKGYMIKFKLKKGISLQNQWVEGKVKEVIIIFPENEQPHLMVFNEEDRHFFLTFDYSVNPLLEKINYKPLLAKSLRVK